MRPYYIPPTIGEPSEKLPASNPNPFSGSGNVTTPNGHYASKARDMFSDLDYKDYLSDSSPSMVQNVKDLLDELLWKYTSVLMAQPFEVAKTILQVRAQDENAGLASVVEPEMLKKRTPSYGGAGFDVRASTSALYLSTLTIELSSQTQIPRVMSQLISHRTCLKHHLPRIPEMQVDALPHHYHRLV